MEDCLKYVCEENVTLTEDNLLSPGVNISTSNVSQMSNLDLYGAYRLGERDQMIMYRCITCILGVIIAITNSIVVISSGLILQKGQKRKNTYLLLGNLSLADTIIGFSMMISTVGDNLNKSTQVCIIQLGTTVCPAIVSIFSLGLIAVDRYIYILHGLYYQRWFSTTKVRISIVCIWIFGVCVGFSPAAGWINHNVSKIARCQFIAVYPEALLLFISLLCTIPIVIVIIVYLIILVVALNTLKKNKVTKAPVKSNEINLNSDDKSEPKINKDNRDTVTNAECVEAPNDIKRSTLFTTNNSNITLQFPDNLSKSISIDEIDITTNETITPNVPAIHTNENESNVSVHAVNTSCSTSVNKKNNKMKLSLKRNYNGKQPNKLRAITVVSLTSFSFMITWMPFFIIVILFVACEDKRTNYKCFYLRTLTAGPMGSLAAVNSILNPLIYAWWHKGFRESIKNYFHKYFQKR